MATLLAFIITILGCVNWLLIGLLQYDFIAGLFGFQASIFSRMVYILFGIASIYLTLRVVLNKGKFKIYEKRKKKNSQENQPVYVNSEAGKEQHPQNFDENYYDNFSHNQENEKSKWNDQDFEND